MSKFYVALAILVSVLVMTAFWGPLIVIMWTDALKGATQCQIN